MVPSNYKLLIHILSENVTDHGIIWLNFLGEFTNRDFSSSLFSTSDLLAVQSHTVSEQECSCVDVVRYE